MNDVVDTSVFKPFDAIAPQEVAARVRKLCAAKARKLTHRAHMRKTVMRAAVITITLAAASLGCAASGTHPDDMSIAEHHREAREHERMAEAHGGQADAEASTAPRVLSPWESPTADIVALGGARFPTSVYDPGRHSGSSDRHRELARQHEEAARLLVTREKGACAAFEPHVRAACPLLGTLQRTEHIAGGVRLVPKPDVDVAAWRAHVTCHLGFQHERGSHDPGGCPLALPNVHAVASGSTIELTSTNPTAAEELRRLSRGHVE